jgi:hypothetical protein
MVESTDCQDIIGHDKHIFARKIGCTRAHIGAATLS